MSVSLESTYDDRALTRYLLGQLAGEDADRLDELAIVDDGMAWRVRTVENDLVDAYVRGTLDAESRRHFETHYLASPKRRAKVRFADAVRRAPWMRCGVADGASPERRRGVFDVRRRRRARRVDHARCAGRTTAAGWSGVARPPIGRRGGGFAYGAAALLLIVACGLLLMRDLRLGRASNESDNRRHVDRRTRELEDQLADQRAAAAPTLDASAARTRASATASASAGVIVIGGVFA